MPETPVILQLVLPSPMRRSFDYLPPADCDLARFKPGQRLLVPFGNREMVGVLLGVSDHSDYLDKLRPAIKLLDEQPLWPPHLLDLAVWSVRYYQSPIGDALLSFLPVLLRKGEEASYKQQYHWVAKPLEDSVRLTARQTELHQLLQSHGEGLSGEMVRLQGFSAGVLSALKEKGAVAQQRFEVMPSDHRAESLLREPCLALNAEQQVALDSLRSGLGSFHCALLQGVTGSGKTEVYLQLIARVLERGQQALVLVPEIGLTPQTVSRFQQRFKVSVAVMHSGMTERERLDAWLMAKRGHARILIGTRSAVLAPLERPGVIIVDEEHDGSFKQQEGFRYSARDIAVMRARAESIPIVLGSATPSLETYQNAVEGRYQWLRLNQRAGAAAMPRFRLLDIRQQPLDDGLSEPLIAEMRQRLEKDEQVMVFLNRRGFAPALMCHDCGWMADCHQCDARMTLHRYPAHLRCHHCDYQQGVPRECPKCQGVNLHPLGAGTERTEQTLERLFPQVPVIRVDRDSTRRKNAMAGIIEKINQPGPCLLLGTQMLAKGHHFPRVSLVAILDADAGLFSADFRGMEKTAQLILQVAGRAGRSEQPGEVIMQTHCADHPRLQCMVEKEYSEFAESELLQRQQAELPPFIRYALIRAEAVVQGRAETFLQLVSELAQQLDLQEIEVVGPMPSPMEKRAGRYRAQLLLQSHDRKALHQVCGRLSLLMEQHKQAKKVRWSIDIDPLDMF